MDSVRFGRALGMGARGAAKVIAMAAEAAVSEKPGPALHATHPAKTPSAKATVHKATVQAIGQMGETRSGLARGGKRFGEAMWRPVVKLSGVLWLELTGVFFGLFLLTALISTWKLLGSLHPTGTNHAEHQKLLWSIAMSLVFGYFCVSSFVRASRRERGKK